MGQGQSVAPQILPPDFNQWDAASASASGPPATLPADFNFDQPEQAKPQTPPQGNAAVRFVRGLSQPATNAVFNPNGPGGLVPDAQGAQPMSMIDYLKDLSFKHAAQNTLQDAKQLNPIVYDPNDKAGSIGRSIMNTILLGRNLQMMRGNAPEPQPQPRPQLALPSGPIPLGPSSAARVAPAEGVLPAARQVVRDANTGQLRDQYLTSVADPNQTLSVVQARALKTPQTIEEFKRLRDIQAALDQQLGAGADEVDARMAEYAKTPVDVGGTVKPKLPPEVKSALQNYIQNRSLLKPQAQDTPITVNPAQPERSIVKQGTPVGNVQRPLPNAIQYLDDESALSKSPQVVGPDTDISQQLIDSIRKVAAQKRRAAMKAGAGR